MPQILLCTVGGSHQPIVSAINDMRPDFVVFICTGKDPATGRTGSDSQIEGRGNCIKAHPHDDKPTLPNIPNQTGLLPEQYQVVLTLADELDRIYLDCHRTFDEISRRFPDARIAADFSGGTKSMSAGLIMAALKHPDVGLQLVTGSRAAQGRYDDAVARVYRLIEWTAQWLLKIHCGLDTSDVKETEIPEGIKLTQNQQNQWQAGLFNAWQLVRLKTQGEAAQFIQREENRLLDHLKIRNQSILAHGFEPVKQSDWQTLRIWMEQRFMPMLLAEGKRVGLKEIPMQLPSKY